jgi:hypothetical protein
MTQPDGLAWLTLFPRWTWLAIGMTMLGVGFSRSRWRTSLAVGLAWCVYAGLFVEETRSLLRSATRALRPAAAGEERLRVVTFNCGGAGVAALEEALQREPDLILLQESPSEKDLKDVAARHWGEEAAVVPAGDVSIVARGRLTLRQKSTSGSWIWATWHREAGDVEVVTLRLKPVPLRLDFWSLDCWRDGSELRQTHRQQIAEVLTALGSLPEEHPCLVAGDFNAPAHDPSLAALEATFCDAFDEAGTGWGNTIVNDCPVHRIDQVWIRRAGRATALQAIPSLVSDHRLVVCDLLTER